MLFHSFVTMPVRGCLGAVGMSLSLNGVSDATMKEMLSAQRGVLRVNIPRARPRRSHGQEQQDGADVRSAALAVASALAVVDKPIETYAALRRAADTLMLDTFFSCEHLKRKKTWHPHRSQRALTPSYFLTLAKDTLRSPVCNTS